MSTADKPRHLSNLALKTLDIVRLAARRGRMDMTLVKFCTRCAAPSRAGHLKNQASRVNSRI